MLWAMSLILNFAAVVLCVQTNEHRGVINGSNRSTAKHVFCSNIFQQISNILKILISYLILHGWGWKRKIMTHGRHGLSTGAKQKQLWIHHQHQQKMFKPPSESRVRTAKGKSSDFNSVQVTATNCNISTYDSNLAKFALKEKRETQCQSSPASACNRSQKSEQNCFSLQAAHVACAPVFPQTSRNIYVLNYLNSPNKQHKTSRIVGISPPSTVRKAIKLRQLETQTYIGCAALKVLFGSAPLSNAWQSWTCAQDPAIGTCRTHSCPYMSAVRTGWIRSKTRNMHLSWTGERPPYLYQ